MPIAPSSTKMRCWSSFSRISRDWACWRTVIGFRWGNWGTLVWISLSMPPSVLLRDRDPAHFAPFVIDSTRTGEEPKSWHLCCCAFAQLSHTSTSLATAQPLLKCRFTGQATSWPPWVCRQTRAHFHNPGSRWSKLPADSGGSAGPDRCFPRPLTSPFAARRRRLKIATIATRYEGQSQIMRARHIVPRRQYFAFVWETMVVTPNSAHSPTHVAGANDPNPAVLNVRRPGTLRGPMPDELDDDAVLATFDKQERTLPPTVMRLPHLATASRPTPSRRYSILSIAHWAALVLGGMIALWLIFGGRRKPIEEFDKTPDATAPARAAHDKASDWKAPPLPSAGDSQAPKWTPPPVPSAGESPAPQWTPPAPAASEPAASVAVPPVDEPSHETPTHEAWPQGGAIDSPAAEPELPPSYDASHQHAPTDSPSGPARARPVASRHQRITTHLLPLRMMLNL